MDYLINSHVEQSIQIIQINNLYSLWADQGLMGEGVQGVGGREIYGDFSPSSPPSGFPQT